MRTGAFMSYANMPWTAFYHKDTPIHLAYYPGSMYELFMDSCHRYPDRVCMDYMDRLITYREVEKAVADTMRALAACGIRKGSRVSICLPNIPQAVYVFYAALGLGAVANMIHPLSARHEIEYCVNLAQSPILFALDAFSHNTSALCCPTLKTTVYCGADTYMPPFIKFGFALTKGRKIHKKNLYSWQSFLESGKGTVAEASPQTANGPAAILYSGGTTGKQKGILLSHLNFNALAAQIMAMGAPEYRTLSNLSIMAVLPMFHGFGLGVCIHSAIFAAGKIILVPMFNADSFAKILKKKKPTFIAGVPTLYEALLRKDRLRGVDFSKCRGIFSGGGSLPTSLKRHFDEAISALGATVQIREGYGLTECVTASALTPIAHFKEGSFGIPFPDTLYQVVRPGTTQELPAGEQGEICLTGPTVMLGYLDEPEETAAVLKKHEDGRIWLHTGDLGKMDEDGFLYFTSRIKRLVKVSGYSVYPNQIEEILDHCPCVSMSCVIGVPDDYKMNRLKAFIVLKEGYEPTEKTEQTIRQYIKENIAAYAKPKDIEFRKELPMTKVGKIAYTVLEEEERTAAATRS